MCVCVCKLLKHKSNFSQRQLLFLVPVFCHRTTQTHTWTLQAFLCVVVFVLRAGARRENGERVCVICEQTLALLQLRVF